MKSPNRAGLSGLHSILAVYMELLGVCTTPYPQDSWGGGSALSQDARNPKPLDPVKLYSYDWTRPGALSQDTALGLKIGKSTSGGFVFMLCGLVF